MCRGSWFYTRCMVMYGDEKRYMVMYRGAWYYTWVLTWVYGDVYGCMVMHRGIS